MGLLVKRNHETVNGLSTVNMFALKQKLFFGKVIKLHWILLFMAQWIKLHFCATPLEN